MTPDDDPSPAGRILEAVVVRSAALALAFALGLSPAVPFAAAQAPADSALAGAVLPGDTVAGPAPASDSAAAPAPPAHTLAAAAPRADTLAPYIHSAPPGYGIRWYEPLVLLGGIALTASLDEPVANHFRDHRSQTGQNVADAWAKVGTIGVGAVTAGVLAGGLISHNEKVTHAGLRLLFSVGLAGGAAEGIKFALGRERPLQNTNALDFDPAHFDTSFPSGHTTLAFAMATSLSDDIHRTWATVGLYGLATGVAVSRVYQQAHWVSDVVGGAALGIASAKLVSGRWRVFGLTPPRFLIGARGPVIGWSVAFRE
jgi:membrane-associated phospholipid phosphatase